MLTESEKQWVAWKYRLRRDKDLAGAWCNNCPHLGRNAAGCYGEPYCPLFPDWQDAAEFEARVAKRLATDRGWWVPCIETHNCEETVWFREKAFDHLDDDIMAEREQFWRDVAVVITVIVSITAIAWSIIDPEN